jgi:hypothetical protein
MAGVWVSTMATATGSGDNFGQLTDGVNQIGGEPNQTTNVRGIVPATPLAAEGAAKPFITSAERPPVGEAALNAPSSAPPKPTT